MAKGKNKKKLSKSAKKTVAVAEKTQETASVAAPVEETAPIATVEEPAKAEAPAATVEETAKVEASAVTAEAPKAEKKAPAKTAKKTTPKKAAKVEKEEKKEAAAEAKKRGPKPKTEAQKAEDAKMRAELKKAAANMVPEMFLQYQGGEVKLDAVVEKAKEAFKADHKRTPIVSLKMYLKPEDNAAYYVVNETSAGKVDL